MREVLEWEVSEADGQTLSSTLFKGVDPQVQLPWPESWLCGFIVGVTRICGLTSPSLNFPHL